jgi:hypothetical protein
MQLPTQKQLNGHYLGKIVTISRDCVENGTFSGTNTMLTQRFKVSSACPMDLTDDDDNPLPLMQRAALELVGEFDPMDSEYADTVLADEVILVDEAQTRRGGKATAQNPAKEVLVSLDV